MNVIRALFMRDIKVGYQWADMDLRGFEPVSTHKHWRPTRVPRIVKHIRRINYAHRLIKKAHRRTVLRRILFNRSKLKITHKPPSTHIHFQSMTVRSQPIPASPCRSLVLTFITLTCFRNTSVLTVRYSYDLSLYIKSTRILMADCEKEITTCGNFI